MSDDDKKITIPGSYTTDDGWEKGPMTDRFKQGWELGMGIPMMYIAAIIMIIGLAMMCMIQILPLL